MVKIKICGITNEHEVEIINSCKPDFVGFVFALTSRRRLDIENAAKLCNMVDGNIKRVGVFVNQNCRFINEAISECGLDAIQLHGDETPDFCNLFKGIKVWKAIKVGENTDLSYLDLWPVDAILLDGAVPGSGTAFDWELISNLKANIPLILAGGLNSNNVRTVIELFKPYAVDVSSGVEIDGHKDAVKIKDFIKAVKEMNKHE